MANPEIAIRVDDLSKIYKLYENPIDRLKESIHPFRKKYHRDFYALQNVNFVINAGESIGIIGKNGSGKSTLLKIITGVLTPSSGNVVVCGKISALLELGTGFNPELTGIENIYFSGTIMGYSKQGLDAKLDDILSFADIGDFVYQPVNTYSSGMFVRLAFAVATSINPEVLIVDEALSVGDEAFQRKCFARIDEIKKRGSTILLVSHSASAIVELCDRALLFDRGQLLLEGHPKHVVSVYQKLIYAPAERVEALRHAILAGDETILVASLPPGGRTDQSTMVVPNVTQHDEADFDPYLVPQSTLAYESRGAYIHDPHLETMDGRRVNLLVHGEDYIFTYQVSFSSPASTVIFAMLTKTLSGLAIGGAASATLENAIPFVVAGTRFYVAFQLHCVLNPGTYFLNTGVLGMAGDSHTFLDRRVDVAMFRVKPVPDRLQTELVNVCTIHEMRIIDAFPSGTDMLSSEIQK